MAKEKVNYQEVYDLYQLCSETKDLREFCADYGFFLDGSETTGRRITDKVGEVTTGIKCYTVSAKYHSS